MMPICGAKKMLFYCAQKGDTIMTGKVRPQSPFRLCFVGALSILRGLTMQPWAVHFYESQAWRRCRASYLDHRQHLCEGCSTPTDPVPAVMVHHIKPLTRHNIGDPRVTLDWGNLEALCSKCHGTRHSKTIKKNYFFTNTGEIIFTAPTPPIK